ncbi:hypothetical protein ACWD6R_17915 [Streptomyces sp. NPDC005151]
MNWSGAAKVAYTYTPRTSATYDKTKPLAPTGVKTAYNTTTRKTTVSWSANKEMDLASYSLYRRPVGSSTWTKVTTTTARSHTDPLVNPDDRTPYYYEVRAKDKAGNTSSGSADTIVRPLPVVASLTGTYDKATGKVALKWPLNTEPHFDHYTVLSNDKVDGYWVWVPLGTTKGNTWTTVPSPPTARPATTVSSSPTTAAPPPTTRTGSSPTPPMSSGSTSPTASPPTTPPT